MTFRPFVHFIIYCTSLSWIVETKAKPLENDIENDMYAKLLLRAVTGSLYPFDTRLPHIVDGKFPLQNYDFEKRKYGLDWPIIGHTMVGWVRLENVYESLQICESEGINGDFVEAGVWRGGASIFAAGIIKNLELDRDVWLFDSFAGFESNPWDGDSSWTQLNEVVAVSLDEVRANFERYDLLGPRVHFVKGYFADTLPQANISSIAVLRMDGDLFSSTSDILYNLYSSVSLGGFIIVDDYEIHVIKRGKSCPRMIIPRCCNSKEASCTA